MLHPSIRLEGSILSADILDAIERGERSHQSPKDFGLDSGAKVKDEIADAWAAARAYWSAYQVKISRLKEGSTGTTETRNQWMVPLLGLLGYQLSLTESETIQQKTYRISHRDTARDQLPVHLLGWHESIDRRSTVPNAPRMSPHGLVQEYINLTEHLYGIVSNGRLIRLLRDSSRLVKLTFIEFDLERIFTEELFSDFALFYRLLHASRLPVRQDAVAEAPIEIYHQDSLDSGSRIRSGLSAAVHAVILSLANGFLNHPANTTLREFVATEVASDPAAAPSSFIPQPSSLLYKHLLRLIYRLLFLMVIEERGLAHVPGTDKRLREIYDLGYSLARLRRLAEKPHFAEARHHDAWLALIALFRLVNESGRGLKIGIAPLAGDLFRAGSLGVLENCSLDNATFLGALRQLSIFEHQVTGVPMRVNYGALNVEEFGSVYQGLLEFEPRVSRIEERWHFAFAQGDERAATGSHYTEDELVQPLLKHSLDHLIADALKGIKRGTGGPPVSSSNPSSSALHPSSLKLHPSEKALLSLRVIDISCGSGHILLAAARRIAMALAIVRTGDDQPSPAAYREAIRDVIKNCIYGVDLNPLAVELCKVALWLEAHVPGEPLNFLDHHIKCGNSIVGFVHQEELDKGVPAEAFKTQPGDDKDIAATFRKVNKDQRKDHAAGQKKLPLAPALREKLDAVLARWREISALPEHTPAEIEAKKIRYDAANHRDAYLLRQIAAIPIAQFYQAKTAGNKACLITDATYRAYLAGQTPQGQATASAWAIAERKKAFHWFLEFPEIIANGGFDCILGNPPYLGNRALKSTFGESFLDWVRYQYEPAGAVDLVVYFFRRMFDLLKDGGYTSLISTNTICQGEAREGGLYYAMNRGGAIAFANPSVKWPGVAAVEVALLSVRKGDLGYLPTLGSRTTRFITSYLDDADEDTSPIALRDNADLSFIGSFVLGKGFVLEPNEAASVIHDAPEESGVISPYLGGADLNSSPIASASRMIINFHDWTEDHCKNCFPITYGLVEKRVKPDRTRTNEAGTFVLRKPLPQKWWIYADKRPKLYQTIKGFHRVLAIAQVSRTVAFEFVSPNQVLDSKLVIFPFEDFAYFALFQSGFHYHWAWRYCTTMKTDLTYTPSKIFDTFPFPEALQFGRRTLYPAQFSALTAIGERYHEHRRELMLRLWLGLTDIYNIFHAPDLDARLDKLFQKRAASSEWRVVEKVPAEHMQTAGSLSLEEAIAGIKRLRQLHVELDYTVLAAYGWASSEWRTASGHLGTQSEAPLVSSSFIPQPSSLVEIVLGHDFHQVETLPENDRTRYTITPLARKELLTRLLKLNHTRAAEEQNATVVQAKTSSTRKTAKQGILQMSPEDSELFRHASNKPGHSEK